MNVIYIDPLCKAKHEAGELTLWVSIHFIQRVTNWIVVFEVIFLTCEED